mmetsp:Transcript_21824/g.22741  ORF Transcript_21824/g.22741 Transcript_21824/m.22741 type:complete len:508 (+) Transcript_21824:3-1526(+)
MNDLLQPEKSYNEISSQLDSLQNIVIKLEKENNDLKMTTRRLADSDKKYKDLLSNLEHFEKEKAQLKEDLYQQDKSHKDLLVQKDLEHTSEINRLKFEIDMYNEKIKSVHSIEKTKDSLQKDLVNNKMELIILREKFKSQIKDLERTHDQEFDDLNNDMLTRINNTKKNIKQINLEHLDVSTKLTLLQNHQLLIELEYQSQQIQDLIQKKEALERRVFELEKDVEIHKEVENVLAEKNKKLSNTLKSVVSSTEKSKPFNRSTLFGSPVDHSSNMNSHKQGDTNYGRFDSKNNTGMKNTGFSATGTNVSSKNKYEENSIVLKLESKIRRLEKESQKKSLERDALKLNFENTQKELSRFTNKSKGILKIFETELETVVKSGEVDSNKELFLDIEKLHEFNYEELPANHKYSLLILLIEYLLSVLSVEDFGESKSLIGKIKKKNVDLKFHNAYVSEEKNKPVFSTLKDSKNRHINNNPTVSRAKIFYELLPSISDSRFALNKRFSVLNSS